MAAGGTVFMPNRMKIRHLGQVNSVSHTDMKMSWAKAHIPVQNKQESQKMQNKLVGIHNQFFHLD